jgi:hypothetical protein
VPRKILKKTQPKQRPPIAFRPSPDLERLAVSFARDHRLGLNEAFKELAALALSGLDYRYYDLVRQLADVMGGTNALIRSCLHIRTTLDGASLATGHPIQSEPERSKFILSVVREFLSGRGVQVSTQGLWFLTEEEERGHEEAPTRLGDPRKKRRTMRKVDLEPKEDQEEENEHQPKYSSLDKPTAQQKLRQ